VFSQSSSAGHSSIVTVFLIYLCPLLKLCSLSLVDRFGDCSVISTFVVCFGKLLYLLIIMNEYLLLTTLDDLCALWFVSFGCVASQ
jgi:hypothetical protein